MNRKHKIRLTRSFSAGILLVLFIVLSSCEQKAGTSSDYSQLELPVPSDQFAGPAGRAPVIQKPTAISETSAVPSPPNPYTPFGVVVAGSEKCRDCERTYAVHDGKGGQIRRSTLNSAECCPCGSTQKFRDGNRYEIRCQGDRIVARMIE